MEPERLDPQPRKAFHRRAVLKTAAVAPFLAMLDEVALSPTRPALAEKTRLPDIQFEPVQVPSVFTVFQTILLTRQPTKAEQTTFADALATVESAYPVDTSGVMLIVSYGMGYFGWLPGALAAGSVSFNNIPRLTKDNSRLVLEEAVPSPTDAGQPGIVKPKFDFAPRLGGTDILISARSDTLANVTDVLDWLGGSNILAGQSVPSPSLPWLFTGRRVQFVQQGLPRLKAVEDGLYYQDRIDPDSPAWAGDPVQQTNSGNLADAVVFGGGNMGAHLTTAKRGSYFDNGAIQHLSHVILDLEALYGQGVDQTALQLFSWADNGTPLHISMDGAGMDTMDIPSTLVVPGIDGTVPKLQFSAFVPTSDFFATMLANQVSLNNGVQPFLTATRRQNFLVPPRRNRAFPLLELT